MHLGDKVSEVKAVAEALTAWRAVPGQQVVSHTEAVLGMLQVSWLRCQWLGDLLRRQVEADEADPDLGVGDDGAMPDGDAPAGTKGLIGHTYSGVKDIGIFATGEAVRALVTLEERERDRCVRMAKAAHDMGIAEAQIQLAEAQGRALVAGLQRLLADLGLDKSAAAHAAVARMLGDIQGAASTPAGTRR